MKTATHPYLPAYEITFDPVPHTYRDNQGNDYESVTSFVKRFFPAFDQEAALTAAAIRTGRTELEIAAEWRAKRDDSANFGSLVHAYAEAVVMGWPTPTPATDRERRAFGIVDKAVAKLRAAGYVFLAAERIIFDPVWGLAGQIDLLARNGEGALAVLDWKTCENITDDAYGRRGLPPIEHIADSKVQHYALQLSTYAWLLTAKGYTSYQSFEGEPVDLAMVHIPHIGDDPVWRPVWNHADEVAAMIGSDLATANNNKTRKT